MGVLAGSDGASVEERSGGIPDAVKGAGKSRSFASLRMTPSLFFICFVGPAGPCHTQDIELPEDMPSRVCAIEFCVVMEQRRAHTRATIGFMLASDSRAKQS